MPVWKPIGVYRTFPLPVLPLPPLVVRKPWVRPTAKQDAPQLV